MQSNATVSVMFPHPLWMAMARPWCILCPAVNIWLTLIRKWPPALLVTCIPTRSIFHHYETFTSDHSLMRGSGIRKGCFLTQWFLRPLNTQRREKCYDQIAERKCGCNNFESFRLLFPDVVTHLCLKFSDKRRFFQINAVQGGDKLCHFENICSHLASIAISVLFHSQRHLLSFVQMMGGDICSNRVDYGPVYLFTLSSLPGLISCHVPMLWPRIGDN